MYFWVSTVFPWRSLQFTTRELLAIPIEKYLRRITVVHYLHLHDPVHQVDGNASAAHWSMHMVSWLV